MEKAKLIEVRKAKRISPQHIAQQLNMDISCYYKREKGQVYIRYEEWQKLAEILDVSFDEIYEPDEKQANTFKDNISSNIIGTNFGSPNIYSIPQSLLENQQKYITTLENEIKELKLLLSPLRKAPS